MGIVMVMIDDRIVHSHENMMGICIHIRSLAGKYAGRYPCMTDGKWGHIWVGAFL